MCLAITGLSNATVFLRLHVETTLTAPYASHAVLTHCCAVGSRPAAHLWLLCTAGTAVPAVRLLTGSNTSLSAGTWQHMLAPAPSKVMLVRVNVRPGFTSRWACPRGGRFTVQAAAEAEPASSEIGGGRTATVLMSLHGL